MVKADYKEEGNKYFKAKEWDKAVEAYTKGISDDAVAPDQRGLMLSNRSQCHLNQEELDLALNDTQEALKIIPSHTKSLFRRATAYEKLGKAAEAAADFVRVAKVEPTNQAAVQAARRLRVDALGEDSKKRETLLHAPLMDILKAPAVPGMGEGGKEIPMCKEDEEKRVDAVKKLRALCVHRQQAKSLIQAGVCEVLISLSSHEQTPSELRIQSLAVLMSMVTGHEIEEEDEDSNGVVFSDAKSKNIRVDKPLEITAGASAAREKCKFLLNLVELCRICRPYGQAMRYLSLIVGYTYECDDTIALETIHDALAFFCEGGEHDVPRSAICALSAMFDRRRRMGTQGQLLVPTPILFKVVESAMNITTCRDSLKTFMASIFALLADVDDRPSDKKVDLPDTAHKMLEPFLAAEDISLKVNGLAALSALFAAKSSAANKMLHMSPAPLTALLTCLSKPPAGDEGKVSQDLAAECLLMTTGDLQTRKHLVEGGGIDMILNSMNDGEVGARCQGLIRAKLVGALAMMAAHNAEVREEVFDRMDFLLELRDAMDIAKETSKSARTGGKGSPNIEEARRVVKSLYESCACLSIHGEWKEELFTKAKKTLKAMQDLASPEDLAEDAQLAFVYSSLCYNLCLSREDKVRPKKREFPFNELGEDDLNALEEFYEKMPPESRPAKNGELDSGSLEVATQIREWLPQNCSVISNLAKCVVKGSDQVKGLVALVYKFLCLKPEYRKYMVSSGGIRALLSIVDIQDERARDAARQALAQILITTNPQLLSYKDQLDAVRPLVEALEHRHELIQFESAMALTNLLSVDDELRTRALQADGWRICRDLLFSDNEQVQRAGLEAMCNFVMCSDIIERFATEKSDLDVKIFCAFCLSEDRPSQIAAAGALAMLCQYEEVAARLAQHENFSNVLQLMVETDDPALQHRAASILSSVAEAEEAPAGIREKCKSCIHEKRRSTGFSSQQADAIAKALLESNVGAA